MRYQDRLLLGALACVFGLYFLAQRERKRYADQYAKLTGIDTDSLGRVKGADGTSITKLVQFSDGEIMNPRDTEQYLAERFR